MFLTFHWILKKLICMTKMDKVSTFRCQIRLICRTFCTIYNSTWVITNPCKACMLISIFSEACSFIMYDIIWVKSLVFQSLNFIYQSVNLFHCCKISKNFERLVEFMVVIIYVHIYFSNRIQTDRRTGTRQCSNRSTS